MKIVEYLATGSAVVFAVCLLALMFFYGSPSATTHPPQEQHAEENKSVKSQAEADKPFWEKATTDPVAAFTLFLVIFTAVLSAVGVLQLNMLNRAETVAEKSAQAAKDSAEIASKTLIASQRPWVDLKLEIVGPFVVNADSAHMTLKYTLKNIGQSPALNVTFFPKFFPNLIGFKTQEELQVWMAKKGINPEAFKGPLDPTTREFKEFCDGMAVGTAGRAKFGDVVGDAIFPKGELSSSVTMNIEEFTTAKRGELSKTISPVIGGCVSYWSEAAQKTHSTGMLFHLKRTGETVMISTDVGTVIPAGDLRLERFFFAGGFAN